MQHSNKLQPLNYRLPTLDRRMHTEFIENTDVSWVCVCDIDRIFKHSIDKTIC